MLCFFLAAPADVVVLADSAFVSDVCDGVGSAFFACKVMNCIIIFFFFLFYFLFFFYLLDFGRYLLGIVVLHFGKVNINLLYFFYFLTLV